LPKEKIERLVNDQIKSKILDKKYLEELVRLVNIELDDGLSLIKEKMANVDKEIREVENKLSRLYDTLESKKLDLNDLAPRIKKLRAKQDELQKARVIVEAEMTLQGYQQVNIDIVRSYAMVLRNLLDESEVTQRKAFLRSFMNKIVVEKVKVRLYYNLPVPPDGRKTETV
jgi:site-specific DNA recombinase